MLGSKFLATALTLAIATTALGQNSWPRYVPENRRFGTLKTFSKTVGTMGSIQTGAMILVSWSTAPLASSLASEAMDDKRLTAEQTQAEYFRFHHPDYYTVIVTYGEGKPGGFGKVFESEFAIDEDVLFLQLKSDPKKFIRGKLEPELTSYKLGGDRYRNAFFIRFPKTMENGEPLFGDTPPKLQVHFMVGSKKIDIELDVADWIKDRKISGVDDL